MAKASQGQDPISTGAPSLTPELEKLFNEVYVANKLAAVGLNPTFQRCENVTGEPIPYPDSCTYDDRAIDPGLRCPRLHVVVRPNPYERPPMVPPRGIVENPERHRILQAGWVPTNADRASIEDFFRVAERESVIHSIREEGSNIQRKRQDLLRQQEELAKRIRALDAEDEAVRERLRTAERPLEELLEGHSEEWRRSLLASPNPFAREVQGDAEPELIAKHSTMRLEKNPAATAPTLGAVGTVRSL